MKLAQLVVPILLLTAGCGASDGDPFVYHVYDEPAPQPPVADVGPRLELVEIRRDREDGRFPTAVLRLVNDTDRAWEYSAYVEGTPLTLRQEQREGEWQSAGIRCGTGLKTYELEPGEGLRFESGVWGLDEKFRIAVPLEGMGPDGERVRFEPAVELGPERAR